MLNLAVMLMLHLLLIAWLSLVMRQRAFERASQTASQRTSQRALQRAAQREPQRQTMGLFLLLIAVPSSGGYELDCMRQMSH